MSRYETMFSTAVYKWELNKNDTNLYNEGIEEKYELEDPLNDTNKSFSYNTNIPTSLQEAINAFEKSELMKNTLGDSLHSNLIQNKLHELNRFKRFVTDYEIMEYLPKL